MAPAQEQDNSGETAATPPSPLVVRHELGKRVEIFAGDKPLLSYIHAPLQYGHPHFHPLFTPSGALTTRSAPADHIWHNGLWFSWKFINGENFWEGPSPVFKETTIEPVSLDDVAVTDAGVRFSARYRFKNKAGTEILDQTLAAKIHAPRPQEEHYVIDLVYTFKSATGDITFDSVPFVPVKTDWGGYAGLTYRPFEQQHYIYSNADGQEASNGAGEIRWKKTRWIDFSIPTDGFPTRWVGVTLMDHPGNLRFPAANNIAPRDWHWNWMQLSLLFEGPHTLPRGEALTLRYRVVIRDGRLDRTRTNRLWESFAKSEPSSSE